MRVLTEPKNALVKQYVSLFELDDVKLTFTEEALREIAKLASAQGTGARGLSSIMESVLKTTMFEVPSDPTVTEVVITPEVITEGATARLVREDPSQRRAERSA